MSSQVKVSLKEITLLAFLGEIFKKKKKKKLYLGGSSIILLGKIARISYA